MALNIKNTKHLVKGPENQEKMTLNKFKSNIVCLLPFTNRKL